MKRIILLLILAVFGVFVYFISFKGMVIYPMIPAMALLVLIYYLSTLVTRKMVEKAMGGKCYYARCSRISEDDAELLPGALAVTDKEAVFYIRKDLRSLKPIWSCSAHEIESYEMKKVDDHHSGLVLKVSGEELRFASSSISKSEAELRSYLGWDS